MKKIAKRPHWNSRSGKHALYESAKKSNADTKKCERSYSVLKNQVVPLLQAETTTAIAETPAEAKGVVVDKTKSLEHLDLMISRQLGLAASGDSSMIQTIRKSLLRHMPSAKQMLSLDDQLRLRNGLFVLHEDLMVVGEEALALLQGVGGLQIRLEGPVPANLLRNSLIILETGVCLRLWRQRSINASLPAQTYKLRCFQSSVQANP